MNLYNTPLEAGVRSLIIVSADRGTDFDIGRIVYYDYFVLYPSDAPNHIDAANDVQLRSPYRSGELAIKREIIQAGVGLLVSKGLVDISYTDSGVFYSANETSEKFLSYFDSEYFMALRANARLVCRSLGELSTVQLEQFVNENISKWGIEFDRESLFRESESDFQ